MDLESLVDPAAALDALASSELPWIIGVRHHSPVLAAAIGPLLDERAPDVVLLELPVELEHWLEWLGHPDATAPLALAITSDDGAHLGFYPFADFSPELVAVRWAFEHDVPVRAIDLPATFPRDRITAAGSSDEPAEGDEDQVDEEHGRGEGADERTARPSHRRGLTTALLERSGLPDTEELWDRMVEVASYGASPERVRRAGLAVGYALRADAATSGSVGIVDRVREAWMRRSIAEAVENGARRPVAVVGAFHAAALLDPPVDSSDHPPRRPMLWSDPGVDLNLRQQPIDTPPSSCVPYSFDLLDSRSGYPAGIRDPVWQQRVWESRGVADVVQQHAADVIVRICTDLRDAGHVAGVPDATEAVRLCRDLASLRDLAAPGRREVLEAIETTLAQGELLGRGRALAKAGQRVLVGTQRGRLAPGTPRSGLEVHVDKMVAELGLPDSSTNEPVELRLDPLRSERDRRRHVALTRLRACAVSYGDEREVQGIGGTDAVGRVWTVAWRAATPATIAFAGVYGVTLQRAAEGALRHARQRLEDDDELRPPAMLGLLTEAAECGCRNLVTDWIEELPATYLTEASLADIVGVHRLLERIGAGHVPALPVDLPDDVSATRRGSSKGEPPYALPAIPTPADLVIAAIVTAEGLAGSTERDDAAALVALVRLVERQRADGGSAGEGRLQLLLEQFADGASPLMQGAAGGALVTLGMLDADQFGVRVSSWLDPPIGDDPKDALAGRLAGALLALGTVLESDAALLDPFSTRLEQLDDDDFLGRLPGLREAFDVLSPSARERFLRTVAERLDIEDVDDLTRSMTVADAPELLAINAAADAAGRDALDALDRELLIFIDDRDSAWARKPTQEVGFRTQEDGPADGPQLVVGVGGRRKSAPPAIGPLDRWRLVLGRQADQLPPAAGRMARTLSELYGRGRGEGSADVFGESGGRSGGKEAPYPSAREWGDELAELFGDRVREEVLGRAAARGRTDALLAVDPDSVTPSVDLLHSVLALKGALPESKIGHVRRLVRRIVDELTRELATRLRPALAGVVTPRPSHRPIGPLDLRSTLRANLHTARRSEDGRLTLAPERFVFNTRARRTPDWNIMLVVDVSGSMEPSTIYSAIVAAIVAGMPSLSVTFAAFSTEVVDLSHLVDDPLSLLLEVSIGGGTNIAKGLRFAREAMTVPARTIVVLVTDFEEGHSVGALLAEVRAIAESGAHPIGLAALNDGGQPEYNRNIARQVVAAGMPVAALSPLELARWIGEQVRSTA